MTRSCCPASSTCTTTWPTTRLPLWSEPGRTEPWLHNKHWPDADTYTESITEPAWVYAKACPEALLGYVQVRAMAGGATGAQGWPTANRGYRTVVRNVDAEDAGTGSDDLIYTSVVTKTGDALATAVRRMGDGSGFIYHCSEGQRGSRVLRDYTDLAQPTGCSRRSSASTAARSTPANWAKWAAADAGGVVWSPLSNLVLYAQTTLIDDVRARGVRVCLGSDWGPSGTKNLLGEMKVARIAADRFGYTSPTREIVEMVTSNPGTLLERCWHRPVGRLVKGGFADVTVVRGRGRGNPWKRIVAATERDVALVVIDGVPRYGDAKPDDRGRSAADVHDDRRRPPPAGGAARPDRHRRRPGRGPRSWTPSKPSSAIRRRRSPPPRHAPRPDPGSRPTPNSSCSWTCPTHAEAAGPAHRRTPPPSRFRRSRRSNTTPRSSTCSTARRSRAACSPHCGNGSGYDDPVSRSRSPPDGASHSTDVLPPHATATWKPVELSVTQRHDLIDVWTTMFTDVYVHYTQKRALYGFDPIRALSALRRQIPYLDSAGFLRELTLLINRLRDQHTQLYVDAADQTLTGYVAALPFLVEPFGPHLSPTYLVTKTNDDVPDPDFAVGARLTTWNGIPFARAVDLYAETLTGGRPDARRARALETLTQRPLEYLPPPDELWVDIGYRLDTDDAGDPDRTIRFEWRAIEPAKALTADNLIEMRTRRAINITSETARRARKLLFATALWERDQTDDHPTAKADGWIATSFSDAVSARKITTSHGTFGYLRLWTFDVEHTTRFVNEIADLLRQMPRKGLIIDLRSNPGGVIDTAERLLQLFTTNRIEPARFALPSHASDGPDRRSRRQRRRPRRLGHLHPRRARPRRGVLPTPAHQRPGRLQPAPTRLHAGRSSPSSTPTPSPAATCSPQASSTTASARSSRSATPPAPAAPTSGPATTSSTPTTPPVAPCHRSRPESASPSRSAE